MKKKHIFIGILILFFVCIITWHFITNESFENLEQNNINSDTEYYKMEIGSYRMGNLLSCYFYNIGLAFLHGKNFQTTIDKSSDIFTSHFPDKVLFDKSVQDAFISAGITDETLKTELNKIDGQCMSAWTVMSKETETFWTIMKPTINKILKQALEKSNLQREVDAPVIHFRCSDSPINRQPYYHFQKYSFFKDSLDMIQRKTGKKYNKVYICYCNTHYSSGGVCDIYANQFVKYLESLGYEVIMKCQSLNEDFAMMFYAPGLISTNSSLSYMAGYFSDGVFIISMYDETKNTYCEKCDDWYQKGYTLKHSEVEDYHDTDTVISMLQK